MILANINLHQKEQSNIRE